MTNLLPPAAKKQIVVEYWTRVVCAWVVLWSVCLFVGVLLLWPTYVLLTGNNQAYSDSVRAATERTNEYQELSNQLTLASKQAEEIVTVSKRPRLSGVLDSVWGAVDPNNIELSAVTVVSKDAQLQPLQVVGIAADRQSLARFRDELESLPFVTSVDLPIENLAKNEDINFSLTVIVRNEKL